MLKSKGFDDSQIQAIIDRDIDGQELNAMLGSFDESKGVKHMTGQGIKGIRYKDGFSRGADGGSSNYVMCSMIVLIRHIQEVRHQHTIGHSSSSRLYDARRGSSWAVESSTKHAATAAGSKRKGRCRVFSKK
jgi:hypothetical protein